MVSRSKHFFSGALLVLAGLASVATSRIDPPSLWTISDEALQIAATLGPGADLRAFEIRIAGNADAMSPTPSETDLADAYLEVSLLLTNMGAAAASVDVHLKNQPIDDAAMGIQDDAESHTLDAGAEVQTTLSLNGINQICNDTDGCAWVAVLSLASTDADTVSAVFDVYVLLEGPMTTDDNGDLPFGDPQMTLTVTPL